MHGQYIEHTIDCHGRSNYHCSALDTKECKKVPFVCLHMTIEPPKLEPCNFNLAVSQIISVNKTSTRAITNVCHLANTIGNPWTVMVKLLNTTIARGAMLRPQRSHYLYTQ